MARPFRYKCVLSLTILLLLSACSQVTNAAPETLVISTLMNSKPKPEPFTIQILQKETLQEHIFILLKYHANNTKGQSYDCLALYKVFRDPARRWVTPGTDRSCDPTDPGGVKSSSAGWGTATLPMNGALYSYMFGQVAKDEITTITVTWGDGVETTVRTTQNAYLVLREGKADSPRVEGKDKTGSVVYHESFSP